MKTELQRLRDRHTEANLVIGQWDRCYDALPEHFKDRHLGMVKSQIVLDYLKSLNTDHK